jgi:dCMP deaminase
MALAELMALRSRCPTGAGCVIVDFQERVAATGYAGPPAFWEGAVTAGGGDTCAVYCKRMRAAEGDEIAQLRRDYRDCPSSHAEMNALMFADRSRTESGVMYISSSPCVPCAKAIANSGIRRVVWPSIPSIDIRRDPEFAVRFFGECRIEVTVL